MKHNTANVTGRGGNQPMPIVKQVNTLGNWRVHPGKQPWETVDITPSSAGKCLMTIFLEKHKKPKSVVSSHTHSVINYSYWGWFHTLNKNLGKDTHTATAHASWHEPALPHHWVCPTGSSLEGKGSWGRSELAPISSDRGVLLVTGAVHFPSISMMSC